VIIWQKNGSRLVFELTVRPSSAKLEAVRQQIARDFPDTDINVTYDNDTAFVRGTVKDITAADRVKEMALTLGKVVNLLRVEVPAEDPQIVLHVRFTDVDRNASRELGMNLASGAFNTVSALGTAFPISTDGTKSFNLSSTVNLLLFRKDLNLIAAIQALEGKNLAQTLAEPNVMAINGKPASFLAGGEMPYPQVQPGAGAASVTIAFKEYGIRLNFLPTVTQRGTIRLQVAPEVSQLDFGNAITIQGFSVPAITTRRVQTEVELGLLDSETTDSWSKVPGIGSIPVLGSLFKTRTFKKSNSELMIIITPEIVRPIPADQPVPVLSFKEPFMPNNSGFPMSQPGIGKTGPVPVHPPVASLPVEQLEPQQKQGQLAPAPTQTVQIIPVPPAPPSLNIGVTPAPAPGGGPGSGGR
jgi:pilus assembly protein CpaC